MAKMGGGEEKLDLLRNNPSPSFQNFVTKLLRSRSNLEFVNLICLRRSLLLSPIEDNKADNVNCAINKSLITPMEKKKRTREKKLARELATQERFFLDRLRKEWDARERSKRREELLDMTKQAGIVVGKTLLVLAALSGVVAVAAIAPNVFSAFGRLGKKRRFFAGRELNAQLR